MDDVIDRSNDLRGNVKVESTGTFACEDADATPEAMQVMEEMGLSLKKHDAEQFTKEWAEWADIILAMSKEHIEQMEVIAPEYAGKMHTFLGFVEGTRGDPVDSAFDLPDPYDDGIEEYRECAVRLKSAAERLAELLEREYTF